MQNKMITGSGGDSNIEIGTVTVTTGEETFTWQKLTQKPTKFIMYKLTSPMTNGNMLHLYDNDISSSNQFVFYNQASVSGGVGALPTTTNDYIQDITASGFKLKTSASVWSGTYTYIAIV